MEPNNIVDMGIKAGEHTPSLRLLTDAVKSTLGDGSATAHPDQVQIYIDNKQKPLNSILVFSHDIEGHGLGHHSCFAVDFEALLDLAEGLVKQYRPRFEDKVLEALRQKTY